MLEDHLLPRLRAGHPVISIVSHEWDTSKTFFEVRQQPQPTPASLVERQRKFVGTQKGRRELGWFPLRDENGKNIGPLFDDVRTSQPTSKESGLDCRTGRSCCRGLLAVVVLQTTRLDDSILWVEDITPYFDTGTVLETPSVVCCPSHSRLLLKRRGDFWKQEHRDDVPRGLPPSRVGKRR